MPSPFVVPAYLTPVASFAIKMSAPAIARPDGSSTMPLKVPLGDCPTAALVRRMIKRNRGRRKRLTRALLGRKEFNEIHPVYGRPLLFVSIFFLGMVQAGRWSVFRTLTDD